MNGQQSPIIAIDQAGITNGPQSHETNAFRKGLSIGDNRSFIVTDLLMHNLKCFEVRAAADSAVDAVLRLDDTGNNPASYIRSGRRSAGDSQVLMIGRAPYLLLRNCRPKGPLPRRGA